MPSSLTRRQAVPNSPEQVARLSRLLPRPVLPAGWELDDLSPAGPTGDWGLTLLEDLRVPDPRGVALSLLGSLAACRGLRTSCRTRTREDGVHWDGGYLSPDYAEATDSSQARWEGPLAGGTLVLSLIHAVRRHWHSDFQDLDSVLLDLELRDSGGTRAGFGQVAIARIPEHEICVSATGGSPGDAVLRDALLAVAVRLLAGEGADALAASLGLEDRPFPEAVLTLEEF